jgi:hypothetical protein
VVRYPSHVGTDTRPMVGRLRAFVGRGPSAMGRGTVGRGAQAVGRGAQAVAVYGPSWAVELGPRAGDRGRWVESRRLFSDLRGYWRTNLAAWPVR